MTIFEFYIQIVHMKLIDKLKDLFIDVEEIDEEEVEEIKPKAILNKPLKEEPKIKLPKIMQDIVAEEKQNNAPSSENLPLNDNIKPKNDEFREMVPRSRSENHNYNFDIDFEKSNVSRQNVLNQVKEKPKKVSELYAAPKKEKETPKKKEEERRFIASPVISPVYGVLDKNYKTDELLAKSEDSYEMQRRSKKIDFETVRRKAFGNLTDDIKNNLCEDCELLKEVKRLEKISEDELMADMIMEDDLSTQKKVTIEDAYDNYSDFGVSYEISAAEVNNSRNTDDVRIVNHSDLEPVSEKVETKPVREDKISLNLEDVNEEIVEGDKNKLEDNKLTEDLFDLIDSMYQERDD